MENKIYSQWEPTPEERRQRSKTVGRCLQAVIGLLALPILWQIISHMFD
jgi:hypothetical protein